MPVRGSVPRVIGPKGWCTVTRRDDYDAHVLLKRNGMYEDVPVNFNHKRGKFWLYLANRDVLCIEAPRLRGLVRRYDEALDRSGLPPITDDGYER